MKAIRITLVSDAATQAQKTGRFHAENDDILRRSLANGGSGLADPRTAPAQKASL